MMVEIMIIIHKREERIGLWIGWSCCLTTIQSFMFLWQTGFGLSAVCSSSASHTVAFLFWQIPQKANKQSEVQPKTNIGHHRQDLWDIYLVTLSANYISRDALGKESLDISFKKTLDMFVKKWTNILKKSFLLDCINHKSDIVNFSLVNIKSKLNPPRPLA